MAYGPLERTKRRERAAVFAELRDKLAEAYSTAKAAAADPQSPLMQKDRAAFRRIGRAVGAQIAKLSQARTAK